MTIHNGQHVFLLYLILKTGAYFIRNINFSGEDSEGLGDKIPPEI